MFEKHGPLKICSFDRNNFGQFLGSATVEFKRPEDAKAAKEDYHGGTLDDRVLIVDYDLVKTTINPEEQKKEPVIRKDGNANHKGKTLKVQSKA